MKTTFREEYGIARVADVTAQGTYKRPVRELYHLNVRANKEVSTEGENVTKN